MGRIIKIDTGWQTVSVVQDFLEVKLGTAQAAILHRAKIMQSNKEAAVDAANLQVSLQRATGSFTSGSGGGTATIVKGQSADAAHGLATIERNNTTQAVIGTGTLDELEPGVWNILAGEWEFCPIPELRFPLGPSEAFILSLLEAPPAALTARALLEIEMIAG
jgi:hypothetical protein